MAEHGGRSIGSETSQGPGWWLASDGRWYPPELSPENRAKKKARKKAAGPADDAEVDAEAPKGAAKGKARRKASAGRATTGKAAAKAAGSDAAVRPSTTHRSAAATGTPTATTPTGGDEAGLELHFDDDAPPTEQIVARRVQAREQHLLLAGARQQAALRALSSLGLEPGAEAAGVATDTLPPPTDREAPIDEQVVADPPAPVEPVVAPTEAVEPSDVDDELRELATPVVPAPHQPTKRPEPANAPMGTEVPFMEVRGSALGTDIERIGEKILIFADRVELRDRGNAVRQTISYADLAGVVIQKKIMGPTLVIESTDGESMTAKALRPELATGAKAMIEKHARRFVGDRGDEPAYALADAGTSASGGGLATATAPAPAPDAPAVVELREPTRLPHKHVLAAMLDELHAAGVLDAQEHADKLALLDALSPD